MTIIKLKKKLEIDKFAIYYKSKNIYYISFTIQDKTSDIQNYYPSLDSKDNILTYEEWTKLKNIDSNSSKSSKNSNKMIGIKKISKMQD